jgi:hypothetical protein
MDPANGCQVKAPPFSSCHDRIDFFTNKQYSSCTSDSSSAFTNTDGGLYSGTLSCWWDGGPNSDGIPMSAGYYFCPTCSGSKKYTGLTHFYVECVGGPRYNPLWDPEQWKNTDSNDPPLRFRPPVWQDAQVGACDSQENPSTDSYCGWDCASNMKIDRKNLKVTFTKGDYQTSDQTYDPLSDPDRSFCYP